MSRGSLVYIRHNNYMIHRTLSLQLQYQFIDGAYYT